MDGNVPAGHREHMDYRTSSEFEGDAPLLADGSTFPARTYHWRTRTLNRGCTSAEPRSRVIAPVGWFTDRLIGSAARPASRARAEDP